mgnify:CR=1 FL=1
MDILNFISWIKGGRQVTTVDSTQTVLPVGLKDPTRDDGYLAGAITVSDLAAQITPSAPYKVYSALLTQTGTNAPVATILQNTIGSMVWSYSMYAPGAYDVVGTLPLGKSVVIAGPANTYGPSSNVVLGTYGQVLANKIIIKSINSSGVQQDGLLYNHFIEIRVYP